MQKQDIINIEDKSKDRRYFTIVPNYILNNSTIYDREVYIQLKKIAGETGKCWLSIKELTTQLGISKNRLLKSIDYLLKHNWIEYAGKTSIFTNGGKQLSNTYKINDIWKLNAEFYERQQGSSSEEQPKGSSRDEHPKGGSSEEQPYAQGGSRDEQVGGSREITNNIYTNKEPINKKIAKKHKKNTSPAKQMKNFLISYQKSKEKTFIRLEEILHQLLDNNQRNEIDNFVEYWTELNKAGTKQRWELQDTFELSRRLKNWFKRSFSLNTSYNKKHNDKPKSTKYAGVGKTIGN